MCSFQNDSNLFFPSPRHISTLPMQPKVCFPQRLPLTLPRRLEIFAHVWTVQVVPQLCVVASHPHARDDTDLPTAVLLRRNPSRLLHQQRTVSLVLELFGIPGVHWHCTAVDVKLPHQTSRLTCQLLPEGVLLGALPQPQQCNQNILFRVLVRQKCLPPAVGCVVAAHKFHLIGPDLVLHFIDAHFACPHVTTCSAKVFHTRQRKLPQVAILDSRRDERHGDVALHAVDARPRRYKSKNSGNNVDQCVGCVVFVSSCPPELVQSRAANDECRIDLEAVGAEIGICKVFNKLV